jgi:hypothetical protein
MTRHLIARIAVGLSSALALGLLPPATVQAAEPAPSTATGRYRCDPPVEPWTAPVRRCTLSFPAHKHMNLLAYPGVWAPNFEPELNGIGRSGTVFAYVGDTPSNWVEMDATLGGILTLSDQYGDYVKGTQRIALYDARGRLVAWDWITLDWDW